MTVKYEPLHTFFKENGERDEVGITTMTLEHPAELWEVKNVETFKSFYSFVEQKLEADFPGNIKIPYLNGLVEIYKANHGLLPEEKNHFIFYGKDEKGREAACVIKHFYLKAAELELWYGEETCLSFLQEFINFIAEWVMEKRDDCSGLITVASELNTGLITILKNIEYNWVGVLHKAFPDDSNAVIYEFIPLTRRA